MVDCIECFVEVEESGISNKFVVYIVKNVISKMSKGYFSWKVWVKIKLFMGKKFVFFEEGI